MFCTNEPCENESIPESDDLHLCRTCLFAWKSGYHQWSQTAVRATIYYARDSLLIRLPKPFDENLFPEEGDPDVWPPENALPFKDLFEALPKNRISCGFLELGEWLGNEYEAEFPISFSLGPAGKVWAEIGDVEDLPIRSESDREAKAGQILDEFLEAVQDWLPGLCVEGPTEKELTTWPAPRMMHWLQQPATLHRAEPAQRRLITGLLAELHALGFHPKP